MRDSLLSIVLILLIALRYSWSFQLAGVIKSKEGSIVSSLSKRLRSSYHHGLKMSYESTDIGVEKKNIVPTRHDLCCVLVSGVVGVDYKERYLPNGHYTVSFPIAVTGHFSPVGSFEEAKPAETMWVQAEAWGEEAKQNLQSLRRGKPVSGAGTLIFNKWIDKTSGEERKQFKLRISKFLPVSFLQDIVTQNSLPNALSEVAGSATSDPDMDLPF